MKAHSTSLPGLTDYSLLMLLSAIFGAAFMLNSLAVQTIPPLTIVCVRLGLAALILFVAAKVANKKMPALGGEGALRLWLLILASAVTGNALPFFALLWAFAVLAEVPPFAAYVSLAMILTGIAIARLGVFRTAKKHAKTAADTGLSGQTTLNLSSINYRQEQ